MLVSSEVSWAESIVYSACPDHTFPGYFHHTAARRTCASGVRTAGRTTRLGRSKKKRCTMTDRRANGVPTKPLKQVSEDSMHQLRTGGDVGDNDNQGHFRWLLPTNGGRSWTLVFAAERMRDQSEQGSCMIRVQDVARGKRSQIGADCGGVALLVESDDVPPLFA